MPDRGVQPRGLSTRAAPACMRARRALALRAMAPRRQRGFSLLELLVALIVVVLVTTLVNFTVNSGGQEVRLRAQVNELVATGGYALDEAQTSGTDYGLRLDEELRDGETLYSFSWLEHHIEGWREPASGKDIFARQRLPAGVTVDLELEDSPLLDAARDDKAERRVGKHGESPDEQADALHPQVVFYASGEVTPGALNVRQDRGGELLWRVEWDLLGRFKVLPRGEPDADARQDEQR